MQLVHMGAANQSSSGLRGYFVTLTAPGRHEHKRWYQGRRPAARPDCTCHEHGLGDGGWNGQESACWNRLRTALTRVQAVSFLGAVETQKRGLLHRHVVMFVEGGLSFDRVQELALAAGYGCVLDVEPLESYEKAARYVAKYVTKSSADRASVPWRKDRLDRETGELVASRKPTYRLWSASRDWGVTMSGLRAIAAAQARQRAMYLRELTEALATEGTAVAAGPLLTDSPSLGPP